MFEDHCNYHSNVTTGQIVGQTLDIVIPIMHSDEQMRHKIVLIHWI